MALADQGFAVLEFAGECPSRTGSEIRIHVADTGSLLIEQLGGAVDRVTKQEGPAGAGREHRHGTSGGVTGSQREIKAGKQGEVLAPYSRVRPEVPEQFRLPLVAVEVNEEIQVLRIVLPGNIIVNQQNI
jgi:hypothetical protein